MYKYYKFNYDISIEDIDEMMERDDTSNLDDTIGLAQSQKYTLVDDIDYEVDGLYVDSEDNDKFQLVLEGDVVYSVGYPPFFWYFYVTLSIAILM